MSKENFVPGFIRVTPRRVLLDQQKIPLKTLNGEWRCEKLPPKLISINAIVMLTAVPIYIPEQDIARTAIEFSVDENQGPLFVTETIEEIGEQLQLNVIQRTAVVTHAQWKTVKELERREQAPATAFTVLDHCFSTWQQNNS